MKSYEVVERLKMLREKVDFAARYMSRLIGKTDGYVTQLEHGNISLIITYLHDGINKNTIEAYSGIKAKARLGRNTIDVIIQPSAMDLLTQVWKLADGFPKCD